MSWTPTFLLLLPPVSSCFWTIQIFFDDHDDHRCRPVFFLSPMPKITRPVCERKRERKGGWNLSRSSKTNNTQQSNRKNGLGLMTRKERTQSPPSQWQWRDEQTLIANEVEGVVPFTQDVRKGQGQQQQSTTKKTKQKLPQFFSDFQSTGIVSFWTAFSNVVCSPTAVFKTVSFWIKEQTEFSILKLSSKESQLKPTVTGQSQEGIMCLDTGLSEHTHSVWNHLETLLMTHFNCLSFTQLNHSFNWRQNICSNMFPICFRNFSAMFPTFFRMVFPCFFCFKYLIFTVCLENYSVHIQTENVWNCWL